MRQSGLRLVMVFAVITRLILAPVPAFAQGAVVTPSNCQWSDVPESRGLSQLWCRNGDGDMVKSGAPRAYNASDYSDGCPTGQYYDGMACVAERRQASPSVPVSAAAPSEQRADGGRLWSLMDELIATDSRGWAINAYRRGSVANIRVLDRTADGRTATVYADFNYAGGSTGWVKARMRGGAFTCVEYWDFAGNCRPVGEASYGGAILVGLAAVVVAGAIAGGSGGGDGGGEESLRQRQNAEGEAEFRLEQNQQRDRNYNSCGQANC